MTTINVEIDEKTLRRLILEYLQNTVGSTIKPENISIEVKSTQNYRSEWESAAFRARVTRTITGE